MNSNARYTDVQRQLHWVVVAIVAFQYLSQSRMKSAMDNLASATAVSGADFFMTTLHTWGGAAAGVIMVYRIKLRLERPVPVGAGDLHGWQKKVASGLHWAFYMVIIFMALTGTMHYYFKWQVTAQWHEWGEWLLLGLIGAHVLAALLHRFYKKDAVMGQMWGSGPPH